MAGISSNLWKDGKTKAKYIKALKDSHKSTLTDYQKCILLILKEKGKMFLKEIVDFSQFSKKILARCLTTLTERGYVFAIKEHNPHARRITNKYAITPLGENILSDNLLNEPLHINEVVSKLSETSRIKSSQYGSASILEKNAERIGKLQKQILSFLAKEGSKFSSEVESQFNSQRSSIQKSLASLANRGFVSRRKDFNLNSFNHQYQFKYSITNSGRVILKARDSTN